MGYHGGRIRSDGLPGHATCGALTAEAGFLFVAFIAPSLWQHRTAPCLMQRPLGGGSLGPLWGPRRGFPSSSLSHGGSDCEIARHAATVRAVRRRKADEEEASLGLPLSVDGGAPSLPSLGSAAIVSPPLGSPATS